MIWIELLCLFLLHNEPPPIDCTNDMGLFQTRSRCCVRSPSQHARSVGNLALRLLPFEARLKPTKEDSGPQASMAKFLEQPMLPNTKLRSLVCERQVLFTRIGYQIWKLIVWLGLVLLAVLDDRFGSSSPLLVFVSITMSLMSK